MTIKEAILKSLEDLNKLADSTDVYNNIVLNDYCRFIGKTPASTVSAQLGDFIRKGDSRVRRIPQGSGIYLYYLTKDEERLAVDLLYTTQELEDFNSIEIVKNYEERDLHKLLSSFLKSTSTHSKTIFHEQSSSKDSNQTWTHPDMVGIRLLKLHTTASQNLLKSVNRVDTFKFSSYELKREITNDSELKKAYFQAVSNSSWANYGYLVAFEFSDNLHEEMARLNQSFGIGIIELKANPYESKVLFPPSFRDLDFKTIDKLCKMNKDFEKFIELTEKLLVAEERYHNATERELSDFCDAYFVNDSEIEQYCNSKNIPVNQK